MSKWGGVNFSEFEEFSEQFNDLSTVQYDEFIESLAKELTARLLALVVPRTPVGQYPKSSGKKGGTLRRGWTSDGNSEVSVNDYVESLNINTSSDVITVEIINPVNYASYVELGHRTRVRKDGSRGWVEGRFMLEISVNELQGIAPQIINRRLGEFLKGVFG